MSNFFWQAMTGLPGVCVLAGVLDVATSQTARHAANAVAEPRFAATPDHRFLTTRSSLAVVEIVLPLERRSRYPGAIPGFRYLRAWCSSSMRLSQGLSAGATPAARLLASLGKSAKPSA